MRKRSVPLFKKGTVNSYVDAMEVCA